MVMTDPLADLFTRIRNGYLAGLGEIKSPSSAIKIKILEILKSEGYILDYKTEEDGVKKSVAVQLKYGKNKRDKALKGIKRISKPGLRIYADYNHLPNVLGGMGIAILTTSSGVMTNKEAKAKRIGGEVIAHIW